MPEKLVRVHLEEVVVHSFLVAEPVPDDEDTLADAAEGVFTHSAAGELEGYAVSIKDRRMVYSEPAS